jgi:hypothetical protein
LTRPIAEPLASGIAPPVRWRMTLIEFWTDDVADVKMRPIDQAKFKANER